MSYPNEIWVDTDLVGDDERHDGWVRYIRATNQKPSPEASGGMVLDQFMSYCNHPLERVTHDITQGDWAFHSIQWCRVCGAFRVSVHTGEASVSPTKYVSPWTLPQDQEQSRLGAR